MKILATSAPSEEHLYPMLPTLWALRNAGHDVLVALPARFAKITAATGLPATRVSDDITICHHCYGLLDENLTLITEEQFLTESGTVASGALPECDPATRRNPEAKHPPAASGELVAA